MREARAGDGPVSSAADVNAKEGKTANGEVPQRKMRPNPVALEAPVSVATGTPGRALMKV